MHPPSVITTTEVAASRDDTPEVVPAALIAWDFSILLGSLCFEADSNARICTSFWRLTLVSWSQGYLCS